MIRQDILKNRIDSRLTPAFIFDEAELTSRAEAIRSLLTREEGRIGFCYSIKANPFLIKTLMPLVDHFEVCSPGELEICKSYKVPPEMIIYSGVNKGAEDVEEAVSYGAGILTAESVRHYELICDACEKLQKPAQVILRLTSQSQFGMSEEDIRSILKGWKEAKRRGADLVSVVGIHYFAGTQRKKLKHQAEELLMLREFVQSLREEFGEDFGKLEYGPGLAYPYFEGDDFSDTLAPLKELADSLFGTLDWCELTVEMGRFLASSCGLYLTSIVDIKECGDKIWCITDGGLNHVNYLGQMMGMKVPKMTVLRRNESAEGGPKVSHTVCGSLCTTNDVLIRDFVTEKLQIGDVLVFANIGAYSVTEGMGLFLSRDLPKIELFDGQQFRLVRDTKESWKINLED